jgi:hypothetical protein
LHNAFAFQARVPVMGWDSYSAMRYDMLRYKIAADVLVILCYNMRIE